MACKYFDEKKLIKCINRSEKIRLYRKKLDTLRKYLDDDTIDIVLNIEIPGEKDA